MTPQAVTIDGETILIPKLTVQQIIDMSVLQNERERNDLLQDMKDAEIEGEERLSRLQAHRKEADYPQRWSGLLLPVPVRTPSSVMRWVANIQRR